MYLPSVSPMTTLEYSDARLTALREVSKRVASPKPRWREKPKKRPGHRQRTFLAVGSDGSRFTVFQRQSLRRTDDFSCGIRFLPPGGAPLTLARYNGGSHVHEEIEYAPHIHRASQAAMESGRKPEYHAEATKRFHSVEGALACLVEDYRVTGLPTEMDQPRLLQ